MKSLLLKGLLAMVLAVVVAGCATTPKVSPEEAIGEQVAGWSAAVVAQDLDKVMTYYSEDFKHYEWGNKAGARDFLDGAKSQGFLEGISFDTSKIEIKLDEDGKTGNVYPIDIKGSFGTTLTMELRFTKEAGGWLITGTDVSGM